MRTAAAQRILDAVKRWMAVVVSGAAISCGGPAVRERPAETTTSGTETAAVDGETGDGTIAPERSTDPAALGLPDAHILPSGLVTSGQPDLPALEAARDRGVRTVISLRAPQAPGSEGEREMVEALGMRFVSIPIASDDEITEENSLRLDAAIEDEATTILHCDSSNRAGAMVALRAFFEDGLSVDAAVERGRAAGLARSEATVTAMLRQACLEDPAREIC